MLADLRRETEAMLAAQRRVVERIAEVDARQREAADVIATQSHTSRALSEQAATSLDEIGAIDGGIRELVQID